MVLSKQKLTLGPEKNYTIGLVANFSASFHFYQNILALYLSKDMKQADNHYINRFNINGKEKFMQEISERATPLATE